MQPTKSSEDYLSQLKSFTAARVGLNRTGISKTTEDLLFLKAAHANAKDSLYQTFDMNLLTNSILALKRKVLQLKSNAANKKEFLLRPDLGRQLNNESKVIIKENVADKKFDVCICISDGLSAEAINNHALPLLHLLLQKTDTSGLTIAPICIVENGRVAISDETGFLSNAKISLVLIGERPGLTAPDSMGAYLTYEPKSGNTDALRNCVSNIHKGGQSYEEAADEIFYLLTQSMQLKLSGSTLTLQNNQITNQ